MNGQFARTAAVALALGLVAAPANAQLYNHPVYFQPGHGLGLTIAADFAVGVNSDAELVPDEKPLAYAGRVTLGVPRVNITAGVGAVNPRGGLDTEISFGGSLEVSVFDVPLVPVKITVLAGAGRTRFGGSGVPGSDVTILDVPIGVAVGIKPPSPLVSVVPWAAPRIHIQRVSFGGVSESEVGFGASGGVNLNLPTGLGFHAALDWITIGDPSVSPLRLGVGAHYKFSIPGLGVPGM